MDGWQVGLTRQDIARAGLGLLNEVGLNGLTLRLIAQELGVKAPALYWHLKNKQELLDEMATQMYADAAPGRQQPDGVRDLDLLAFRARALRQMLLAYRDGAKVFSGTYLTDLEVLDKKHPLQERIDAGLDPVHAARALFTLYAFVIGFATEEQAVYPSPGELDERYASTPAVAVVGGDVDRRFDEGVAMVLHGVRAWLKGEISA